MVQEVEISMLNVLLMGFQIKDYNYFIVEISILIMILLGNWWH